MLDLACLRQQMHCAQQSAGLLADVTFKRVDEAASGSIDPVYDERRPADKVFKTWALLGDVDENPRSNTYGRVGGEVQFDVTVVLYDWTATGGTEIGTVYDPQVIDYLDYRGVTFEVQRVERIQPIGASDQLGYRIDCGRFR